MKSWQLNVPKIAHFYFGGSKLIYIRFLSIKTFMKFNPDWKVIFWHPLKAFTGRSWGTDLAPITPNERLCKDYMPELNKLPIIKQVVDFKALGFRDNSAEVHKNDYIRINALYQYGGLWSDTDIIYFKPVTELSVNKPENKDKEVFVCISDYGHSTGLNMAVEKNQFFGTLLENMNLNFKANGYQCLGPDLFNKYFRTLESIPGGVNIDMDSVYAHNCHHVKELLGTTPRFTEGSIGCHWYGGNAMWVDFLNKTAGGEKNLTDNIISNLIRDAV